MADPNNKSNPHTKPPRRRIVVAIGAIALGLVAAYVWFGSRDKLAGSVGAVLLIVGLYELFRPIKN